MADFDVLQITLDRKEPWKSRLELDGEPVNNVFAVRIEQTSPTETLRMELSTYGNELVLAPAVITLHAFCPHCRRSLDRCQL